MTKLFTRQELTKKTVSDLKELAEENGIDIEELEDTKKPTLINALLEIEVDEDEEELDEEEVEVEEEEELDDEEEIEADEVDEVEEEKPAKKTKKPAVTEGTTLAAKQVATILGTEAKTLRQFFRSPASTIEPVGSGGRYEFNESDVPIIQKEFEAWKAGHASRGAKRGEGSTRSRNKRGAKVAEVTEVEEIEELEIEELEDPDEEELELEDED